MALDLIGLASEHLAKGWDKYSITGAITLGILAAGVFAFMGYRSLLWLKVKGWQKDKALVQEHIKEQKALIAEHQKLKAEMARRSKDDVFREITPYDFIERPSLSKWSWEYWKQRSAVKDDERTIGVRMELRNGNHRTFLIKQDESGFHYKGGKYIVDNELKYYDADMKTWCLDYHEDFCVPIRRKIPVASIRKALLSANISEVEFATNPQTLDQFITARIAEGIMKGQELDAWMTQIRVLVFINLIAAIAHLLLFMKKTGMLDKIKLPF